MQEKINVSVGMVYDDEVTKVANIDTNDLSMALQVVEGITVSLADVADGTRMNCDNTSNTVVVLVDFVDCDLPKRLCRMVLSSTVEDVLQIIADVFGDDAELTHRND